MEMVLHVSKQLCLKVVKQNFKPCTNAELRDRPHILLMLIWHCALCFYSSQGIDWAIAVKLNLSAASTS